MLITTSLIGVGGTTLPRRINIGERVGICVWGWWLSRTRPFRCFIVTGILHRNPAVNPDAPSKGSTCSPVWEVSFRFKRSLTVALRDPSIQVKVTLICFYIWAKQKFHSRARPIWIHFAGMRTGFVDVDRLTLVEINPYSGSNNIVHFQPPFWTKQLSSSTPIVLALVTLSAKFSINGCTCPTLVVWRTRKGELHRIVFETNHVLIILLFSLWNIFMGDRRRTQRERGTEVVQSDIFMSISVFSLRWTNFMLFLSMWKKLDANRLRRQPTQTPQI